jgi:NADPH-dependent ferric siderophore reductase
VNDARRRGARPQTVLEVTGTERISPHLVRVRLGGPGFASFEDNAFTDRYVKLMLADPRHGLTPPYDLAELRASRPEALPAVRTYTVREVDAARGELAIDFVVHGDEGIAGPWASAARVGDVVALSGPGGGYAPDPAAAWHLLVGDLSAVPAIAAALEAMPDDAVGHVLLHAGSEADELDLPRPAGIELRWVRADGDDAPLLAAVAALDWRPGQPQAFVHGERGAVKALRRHLTDERQVPRENLSISAYWALGRVEDQFQAEKREPVGAI